MKIKKKIRLDCFDSRCESRNDSAGVKFIVIARRVSETNATKQSILVKRESYAIRGLLANLNANDLLIRL